MFNTENIQEELIDVEKKKFHLNNLPKHACSYCGISNETSVVKCAVCDKWFCNGRGITSSAHIIMHLICSKHKRVSLHSSGPVGDEVLECYNCGRKNAFLLGFVRAKTESLIVLLCREPCLNTTFVDDLNWDLNRWQPLIKDRMFLDWLVKEPSKKQTLKARQLTSRELIKLEELWLSKPDAVPEDLENTESNSEAVAVLIVYEDANQYKRIYNSLLKLEADYDKNLKDSQTQSGIQIRWDLGLNQQRQVFFALPRYSDTGFKFKNGNELKLILKKKDGNSWESTGQIIMISESEIKLELECSVKDIDVPTEQSVGFEIEFVWKSTTFDRCCTALNTFSIDDRCITTFLYHRLLGHNIVLVNFMKNDVPEDFNAPGLPELNHSQIAAVECVLQNPLSLIQGPPGTGKTVTSAAIAYNLSKTISGQVLVVAPSNIAVDQLCYKIHQTGLKVVRLCAKSRECISTQVDFLALHNLIDELAAIEENQLYMIKKKNGELSVFDEKYYKKWMWKTEYELLKSADVICSTCVGSGDPRLNGFRFSKVLIDESAQATEPECLISLVKGAKQIVLVGDHYQLGPVIMCKKAAKGGFQRSLFERLILLGNKPIRLQVQYRMHPTLSEFPSNTFYEGTLQNGVNSADRSSPKMQNFWPNSNIPMFFYHSRGVEEFAASGTSYINRLEAKNVQKIVFSMLKRGIQTEQIGVITPYEGQRAYIQTLFMYEGTISNKPNFEVEKIEVASVDAFQGREKDYIILSTVRSNDHQGIGFLNDPRRLNVSITRARHGLIIVGNPKILSNHELWNNLLIHFKDRNCLVEGSLDKLKICIIQFSKPKRRYKHRCPMMPIPPRRYGDNRNIFVLQQQILNPNLITGIPLEDYSTQSSFNYKLFSSDITLHTQINKISKETKNKDINLNSKDTQNFNSQIKLNDYSRVSLNDFIQPSQMDSYSKY